MGNIYFNVDSSAVNGLEANGLRLSAILENEVTMMLADMASIRKTNALKYLGDVAGSGSDAVTQRFSSIGAKTEFSATANEDTDVGATTPTYSTSTCTVARNSLVYAISDLATLTGYGEDLSPWSLAASMAQSAEARIMSIVCSTFGSASTSVGVSGAALTLDDFFDAVFQLELNSNFGETYAVLHSRQIGHLVDSLRSESNNALAYSQATAAQLDMYGQGFGGRLLGVNLFKSNRVALDGGATNRVGAMFSAGGVAYAIGSPQPIISNAEMRPAGTPIVVEMERSGAAGITKVIGHLFCGAALTEQERIVKIVTSAS